MISRLAFASCYLYSPGGTCPVAERSRQLRASLKAGDGDFLHRYSLRVRQQAAECRPFADFFGEHVLLIPVPGSALSAGAGFCVAGHLAAALLRAGMGQGVWAGLKRVRTVRKSATAPAGKRPTVRTHYDSFAVEAAAAATALPDPRQIVLIDDVVTKGRTLLAAATRVREAFPRAQIRGFALLRTMGFVADIDRLFDPCLGEIRWKGGDARRNP
jgi:hypothetical protein